MKIDTSLGLHVHTNETVKFKKCKDTLNKEPLFLHESSQLYIGLSTALKSVQMGKKVKMFNRCN